MTGYTRPRALAADDEVAAFDSGEPSLDEYLRKRALSNHLEGASRCIVTTHGGQVVGYYALASAAIYHQELRGRVRRNMPDPVPGVLLSRLAVDQEHQGSGLGRQLLRDAIRRTIEAADLIGVRVLLVHALHDRAREFYAREGFESSPTDPLHLMLLIKDARASLDAT
ncbi:GNAT family N-acetyltransferase [Nocardioides speluncae]|uniref:GNAT family N-acetyltransferase n=1 Tax=Nocardioides speluncae TaxID=2670337 RepID=UPI000D6903E5|nr:GNAT family N-acetyltransferase [Nocardioides speluncae]